MKVILAYKNFAANRNISHIGLGVAALNNMKSLVKSGVSTLVWPITSAADLRARLLLEPDTTHVNISAPWIPSAEMQCLLNDFPGVTFSMTCHNNVGFLQADSNGVRLFREAMEIERASHNFHVSGNVSASYSGCEPLTACRAPGCQTCTIWTEAPTRTVRRGYRERCASASSAQRAP